MIPGKTYRYTLKKTMVGHDVWALQINLNNFANGSLVADGNFGPKTEAAVKAFQISTVLVVDGIAGPTTQRTLASTLIIPPETKNSLPPGLLKGIVEGESGWMVGAVNWGVPGGVDCGWVQRRVVDANFDDEHFFNAFDGLHQFNIVAISVRDLKDSFYGDPGAQTHKRAWELAILSHNWPAGAATLASGKSLSNSPAVWVTAIGVPGITTPAQWADYYIMTKSVYISSWPA